MTTYNAGNGEGLNRILLFKPQQDMTYIRKLSMSYGYYVALAVVDRNNKVTHVGVSNSFQIVPFEKLNTHDLNILGNEKCSRLKSDDLMSIYRIKKALQLKRPYLLTRDCRGMRYTLPEENYEIKQEILNTIQTQGNVHEEINTPGTTEDIYNEHVELDIDNITLDEEIPTPLLETFTKPGATGQTRLY